MVRETIEATPQRVFAVLADGWLYSGWVVGTSHIRDVDDDWPQVGSRIHHSVGPWPLTIEDRTEVSAVEPGRLLELSARLWPLGAATVRLELHPVGVDRTEVVMSEEVTAGPGSLIPGALQSVLLRPRNVESLRRLAALSQGRAR